VALELAQDRMPADDRQAEVEDDQVRGLAPAHQQVAEGLRGVVGVDEARVDPGLAEGGLDQLDVVAVVLDQEDAGDPGHAAILPRRGPAGCCRVQPSTSP
jgi:hypothetical protein